VRTFQPVVKGLKPDGFWGWRTRNAAAAILGVKASTLPATHWPEPKAKPQAPAPAPKKKKAAAVPAKAKTKTHKKKAQQHAVAAEKHAQAAAIEQAIADGIKEVATEVQKVDAQQKATKHKKRAKQHAVAADQHTQAAEHAAAQDVTTQPASTNTGLLLAAMWYFSRRRAA
jgi:hypothetical protein